MATRWGPGANAGPMPAQAWNGNAACSALFPEVSLEAHRAAPHDSPGGEAAMHIHRGDQRRQMLIRGPSLLVISEAGPPNNSRRADGDNRDGNPAPLRHQ